LTIAHRNSKRYASWALKKYGKQMVVRIPCKNDKEIAVRLFMLKAAKVKWHISSKGQLNNLLAASKGVSMFDLSVICSTRDCFCVIPNCPNIARELYSIKHRKRIKSNETQKKIHAYTAKQISVCKKHYLLIHSGKYDGPSLRKLRGYTLMDFE
jgi:hypothetical protein